MTDQQLFATQAAYNRWMNRNLYRVCGELDDARRKRDLGAFFGSIHGTLNHLLLVDRLWMGRFTGTAVRYAALDQELYGDFAALRHEREQTDRAIIAWVAGLDEAALARRLEYLSMLGQRRQAVRVGDALLHLFHHQTHHRGQLTTLLSQLGVDFGVTDLLWMPGVELASLDAWGERIDGVGA